MIQKFYALMLFMALTATAMMGQTRTITDTDLTDGDYTWATGETIILDGYVYLEGGTLTIEPGVIVKGKTVPSNGSDLTSALIITRDAQIFAEGTAENPIIFTAEIDPLDGSLDATVNQLWGGVIILGDAPIGEDIVPAVGFPQDNIEGIPSTETRTIYGGTDPEDNSGIFKYVSIRHGGSIIAGDNEINGLTMGGVGSETDIDYVEIFANKDDGIEIFGGTVNVKHAIAAFCGDDGLDFDESWDGFVQFAFTITSPNTGQGEHSVEYDGSESTDLLPQTTGRIYNATFVGAGVDTNVIDNKESRGLRLREDAQAQFWNCIWTNYTDYVFRWDNNARDLTLANNIVWNYNGNLNQVRTATGFTEEDPALAGISWLPNNGLDPRLDAGSPALTGAAIPSGNEDGSLIKPPFRGAFGNELNWASGWTALSDLGYFGDLVTPEPTELITLKDTDINAGETLTLDATKEYLLDGFVFVEDGATLIIPAGTVLRGKTVPSTGELASALIIARGGRVEATGTADAPIIMTSELDDLTTTTDLTATDNQTWGGLIILGNAPIGEDVNPDFGYPTEAIEGIPTTEARGLYGGTDPEDDSGTITYVSVRHGGAILGADNEINGITMGGVGSGTVVDYVEVFANKDDGIEIFGGTVNVKHAVVGFAGDDALDFDESWDGFVQFALTMTAPVAGLGEHGVEYDGSEDNSGTQPRTTGRIYNATFIGAGMSSANGDSRGLRLREDAQAQFWNCIWTEQTDYVFRWDDNARDLTLANNIIWNYGGAADRNNRGITGFTEEDPKLAGISWSPDGGLDPRLDAGSPALTGAALPGNEDGSLIKTPFRGAFGNELNWAEGWSAMSQYGYFGDLATPEPSALITLRDTDINAGESLILDNTKEYLLDGFVFVEDGATLIIPAGTVLRGKTVPSTGELASALIIARGGRVEATGTADAPIIMTSELDDLTTTTDLTATDNQTWGGLIILGNAPIGEDVNPDFGYPTEAIEGIPTTEARGLYGGTDPEDDSGIITYVSVRHGGAILGADNEINGITMGGVGSATMVDHVEVFANKDDGIEIFGGTVNVTNAVVAFCGDDALDFDESWNGSIQFAFTITAPVAGLGEHAVEYDGSEDNSGTQPRVTGRIFNATFIGAGMSSANGDSRGLRLREDAQGEFWNCIWTEMTDYAFRWDDNARDLILANNVVYNIGGKLERNDKELSGIISMDDPMFGGISWEPGGGLDPRLDTGSYALTGAIFPDNDPFATVVDFHGAFGNSENWADGWTALAEYGYFGDLVTTNTVDLGSNAAGVMVAVPYPSPAFGGTVNIDFDLPQASQIALQVMDMSGRVVSTRQLDVYPAGQNVITMDVSNFKTGTFILAVHTELGTVTRKFSVMNQN